MERVYIICLIVGILIPLLNLLVNILGNIVDFVSIDLLHVSVGDWDIDFLPLSINSLSLWSLLFGGFGLLLTGSYSVTKVNFVSFAIGYVAAVLLQTLINRLKRVKNLAVGIGEILLKKAVVSNTIPKNGIGAVCINLSTGSNISYPAKSENGEAIPQDSEVEIREDRGDYLVVSQTEERRNSRGQTN